MANFDSFLGNLNSMGFYNFVLPWILFLSIFFVILQNAPFMPSEDKRKKQVAIIVSAILSFFAVNFPVNGIPLGTLLSNMFGWGGIYIAGVLVVLLFLGMFGFNLSTLIENKVALSFVMLLLAIMVLSAAGFPILQLDETTWTLIFVVLLVGGAMLFLADDKKA